MTTTIEILEEKVSLLQNAFNELKEFVTGQQTQKHFTVAQVATKLGLSTAGVNFHIRQGNIKTSGTKQRFKKIAESELNRYIAMQTTPEAKG